MFTFLDPALDGITIASTTNKNEGAINSPLRDLLRHHRGLREHHHKRALEWWLYTHCPATGTPAATLHNTTAPAASTNEPDKIDERIGPALYDTTLTAEEGLWHRSGWAGRTRHARPHPHVLADSPDNP